MKRRDTLDELLATADAKRWSDIVDTIHSRPGVLDDVFKACEKAEAKLHESALTPAE